MGGHHFFEGEQNPHGDLRELKRHRPAKNRDGLNSLLAAPLLCVYKTMGSLSRSS